MIKLAFAAVLVVFAARAGTVGWNTPEALASWTKRGHQVASASVKDGALHVVCGGTDTHLYSGTFDIASSASQEVVFRAKGNRSGTGEIFWMEPGKGPTQKQSVCFEWIGDGEWHDYRVRPFWQGERRIGQLRLDFPPSGAQGGVFSVASIGVDSTAKVTAFSADKWGGLVFDVKADAPGAGHFAWASSVRSGLRKKGFRHPGDGRVHRIYLDLAADSGWSGTISWTNLVVDAAQVSSVAFVEGSTFTGTENGTGSSPSARRESRAVNAHGASTSNSAVKDLVSSPQSSPRSASPAAFARRTPRGSASAVSAPPCS